jgi:hypothetical protein
VPTVEAAVAEFRPTHSAVPLDIVSKSQLTA